LFHLHSNIGSFFFKKIFISRDTKLPPQHPDITMTRTSLEEIDNQIRNPRKEKKGKKKERKTNPKGKKREENENKGTAQRNTKRYEHENLN